MRALLLTIVLCATALGLTACGERNHIPKTEAQPWDSPEAGGAKTAWQDEINSRTHNQTEYR
ncbi:MAG: hypothetical protein QOD26_2104 [Betaproteobacteria bacterium]|nr:hypothetical protein [Betaproteobacteria bacterium]